MKLSTHVFFFLVIGFFLFSAGQAVKAQCISLTGSAYTQDFNTLANTGTANTALPPGILFLEAPGNTTYAADAGGGSAGNTYSYGTGTTTERSLGEVTSSSVQSTLGACFTNDTGFPLTSISLSYTGEQWRLGNADVNIDRLDFQYSSNATALNNGTWTDVNTLDFTSPSNTVTGAKDGNAAANRTVFPATPFALTGGIPTGGTFYIRWLSTDIASTDDGLAIDDLTVSTAAPTAASVEVSGQVTNGKNGISGVRITLINDAGVSRSVITNSFGFYRIEGIEVGRVYTIQASSKRYAFDNPTQVLQINDAVENIDFNAYER